MKDTCCGVFLSGKNIFCTLRVKILLTLCHTKSKIKVWHKKRGEEMSPHIGRPKAENPKNIRYSIRLDEETENKLSEYCKKNNISKGEAIRRGIHLLLKTKKE